MSEAGCHVCGKHNSHSWFKVTDGRNIFMVCSVCLVEDKYDYEILSSYTNWGKPNKPYNQEEEK